MAELFLSYAHEDVEFAEALAGLLEANGLAVWWDRRMVPGDRIHDVLDEQIESAKAVIVLWSRTSVKSDWVLGEAQTADELKKLVTIKIQECRLPLNYRGRLTPDVYKKGKLPELAQLLTDKFKPMRPSSPGVQPQPTEIKFTDKSTNNFFAKLAAQRTLYEKELAELAKREGKVTGALPSGYLSLIRKKPLGAAVSIGAGLLTIALIVAVMALPPSVVGFLWGPQVSLAAFLGFLFFGLPIIAIFWDLWKKRKKKKTTTTVTVACPHCQTPNRVPTKRRDDKRAICGNCHQPLFPRPA